MYIKKVEIKNIRSITEFVLEFPEGKEAGWHVLIGDNGAGKSTILKAIALVLLGQTDALRIDPNWESWVRKGEDLAQIKLVLLGEDRPDLPESMRNKNEATIKLRITPESLQQKDFKFRNFKISWDEGERPGHYGRNFSCAFGPFRRFTGGETMEENGKITPLTPYITLFRPEIALTSTLAWIKDQYLRTLENDNTAGQVIEGIKDLVAFGNLLPDQLVVEKINADGVFFKDTANKVLHINDLSDGLKSVLSLTFELIRLILNKYSVQEIFENFSSSSSEIPVAGVVLIDEIDAHLHPSWQTRIGQWFTMVFPKLQFIVTTHSPLICRASENGSIWRLASPGSEQVSREVTGTQRDRLIFGNVLDAYGTQVFGSGTARSAESNEKMNRLAELNVKSITGQISREEEEEYRELQSIFPTGKND